MLFCEYYETANIEQRNLIEQVIREVFYLTAQPMTPPFSFPFHSLSLAK